MIQHNYGKNPYGYEYAYSDILTDDLEDYELDDLIKVGVEEIWFWYARGGYEGSGQMLMRGHGGFDVHDMGHCSCYGPTERVTFNPKETLSGLRETVSDEYDKEIAPLIEMAQKDGWM